MMMMSVLKLTQTQHTLLLAFTRHSFTSNDEATTRFWGGGERMKNLNFIQISILACDEQNEKRVGKLRNLMMTRHSSIDDSDRKLFHCRKIICVYDDIKRVNMLNHMR